jgi:hypothetical protein
MPKSPSGIDRRRERKKTESAVGAWLKLVDSITASSVGVGGLSSVDPLLRRAVRNVLC